MFLSICLSVCLSVYLPVVTFALPYIKHPAEGVMSPQSLRWTLFLRWHTVPIIQTVRPVWFFHSDSSILILY